PAQNVAWNSVRATLLTNIQTALNALGGANTNYLVAAVDDTHFTVTLQNAFANSVRPILTAVSSLTAPPVTITPANIVVGSASANAVFLLAFGGPISGGKFTLTFDGAVTPQIDWSANGVALANNIQAAFNGLGGANTNFLVTQVVDNNHVMVTLQNALA